MKARSKKILIYSIISALLVATVTFLCCHFFIKRSPTPITLSCVDCLTLEVGESEAIPVSCSIEDATLSFKSSDSNIARVENGIIYGVAAGNATIRITASSDYAIGGKNINITVIKTITDLGVSLDSEITLYLLDKQKTKANADGFFDNISYTSLYPVTYSLSNSDVINITNTKITARTIGEVTITFVSTTQPEVKSIHTIKVLPIMASLIVSPDNDINLSVGEKLDLSYTLSPVYYTGTVDLSVKIADEEIASLASKRITANAEGETTVNFYINEELYKSLKITVTSAHKVEEPEPGSEQEPEPEVYTLKLLAQRNCNIIGNQIIMTSSTAFFSISVFDSKGEKVTVAGEMTVEGITISTFGGKYKLQANEDCSFKIIFEELNIEEEFFVTIR